MKNIDLFGSQILFRFQAKKTYNTSIGGFFTLGIAAIIIIRLVFIIEDVYQRKNPFVISKERQVDSPAQFIMNKKTSQFAFGMQDPEFYQHYIDPSIYKLEVIQVTKTVKINPSTNKKEDVWSERILKSGQCNPDYFQNQSTRDNFLGLQYQNMYCIDPEEEMIIEGDYVQDIFQYVIIRVMKCTDSGCKSSPELDKMLLKGFFAIYFSDILVDPVIKDNPFRLYNRDFFWTTTTSTPRDIVMNYRNNYVESDFGWITSDIQTQRYAQYTSQEITVINLEKHSLLLYLLIYQKLFNFLQFESYLLILKLKIQFHFLSKLNFTMVQQSSYGLLKILKNIQHNFFIKKLIPDETKYFLQVVLRFEKQKENLFQRKYKNVSNIISEIGGFSQTVITIGLVICSYLSEIMLNKSIINEAFNFQMEKQNFNEQEQGDEFKSQQDIYENYPQNKLNQSFQNEIKSPVITSNIQLISSQQEIKHIPQGQKVKFNQEIHKEQTNKNNKMDLKKQVTKNQIFLSEIIQNKHNKDTGIEKSGKSEFESKKIQDVSQVLNSNLQKSKPITDNQIKKILHKETSDLKLSILEYIKFIVWPFGEVKRKKKMIDYSIDKLYYHIDVLYVINKLLEVDKLKRILMDKDQIKLFEFLPKPTITEQEVFKEQKNQQGQQQASENNLYQDTRTEVQKLQEAYQAYRNIKQRNQPTSIDKKILQNLDENLEKLFILTHEEQNINYLNSNDEINNPTPNDHKDIQDKTQTVTSQMNQLLPHPINEKLNLSSPEQNNNQLVIPKQDSYAIVVNNYEDTETEHQIPEDDQSQKNNLNQHPSQFNTRSIKFK